MDLNFTMSTVAGAVATAESYLQSLGLGNMLVNLVSPSVRNALRDAQVGARLDPTT
jgi:hypothetical protein